MTDACPTALIDPNRLFRDGLRSLLAGTRFAVAAEFATVEQALAQASGGAAPGLLVAGQAEPVPEDLHRLRQAYPAPRIVVLADRLSVGGLRNAMAAGVDGFLVKSVSPEALVQSLQLILLGEKVFPTNLAALLTQVGAPVPQGVPQGAPVPQGPLRGLTAREQEILLALVAGASNKLIANRLGITEVTVKAHLKTLLRKIKVTNRTQAAIWAMNNGLGAPPAPGAAPDLRAVST